MVSISDAITWLIAKLIGWALPEAFKRVLRLRTRKTIWVGSSTKEGFALEAEVIAALEPVMKYFFAGNVHCATNKHPTIPQKGGAYHYIVTPEKPDVIEGVGVWGAMPLRGKVTINGKHHHVYRTTNLMHTNEPMNWQMIFIPR